MLDVVLSPVAGAIVAVAAYSPLRRGEIEGLRWEDWQNGVLNIKRSIWNGQVLDPKTQASGAVVPVIPSLAGRFNDYRAHLGRPFSAPCFLGHAIRNR